MNTRPSQSLFCNSSWKWGVSMLLMAVFAFFIVYGVAYAAGIWATPVPMVEGINAQYTSLVVVNGRPAISYYDSTTQDLMYIRAEDADGKEWPLSAVQVATVGDVGQFASLATLANGIPAISYYNNSTHDLYYVRANDIDGTAWLAPVPVDSVGDVGQYASLEIVDGNPAISYYDATNGLKYERAADPLGVDWITTPPVIVDNSSSFVGYFTSLAVVNGFPAISYHDSILGDLKYVRALDASGTSWEPTPRTLDSITFVGAHTSLAVVANFPAISYYDGNSGGGLKFIRATESTGMTIPWNAPVIVDSNSTGDVGRYTSLVVVSGNPAISYYDFDNGNLKYARALNPDGSLWNTPAILDDGGAGNVGQYSSMAIVDGNPAVSYSGSLWFVRSETPSALSLTSFGTRSMILPASIGVLGLILFGLIGLVFYRKIRTEDRLE